MKVINSGSAAITFITNGKHTVLQKGETADIDERTFVVLNKIFPALIAAVETEVVIESEPKPIEEKKKGTKNGNRKKSK